MFKNVCSCDTNNLEFLHFKISKNKNRKQDICTCTNSWVSMWNLQFCDCCLIVIVLFGHVYFSVPSSYFVWKWSTRLWLKYFGNCIQCWKEMRKRCFHWFNYIASNMKPSHLHYSRCNHCSFVFSSVAPLYIPLDAQMHEIIKYRNSNSGSSVIW